MKLFNEKYQYKAFTLAEVLITLLIIGVVASLVVPNLINDAQNEEFYALLKKDYSALSDASRRMLMDAGGNFSGYFGNSLIIRDKFSEYMIFTKKCIAWEHECFYAGTNSWKTLSGDYGWLDHTSGVTATTVNGGSILFGYDDSSCNVDYGTGSPAQYSCGWLHLDVNGFKGPNVMGRDIYAFWITKNGIYPFGMYKDNYSWVNAYCNINSSNSRSGRGCAAKVLKGDKID